MGKDSEKGKYTSPEGSYTWEYLSTFFCSIGAFCLGCTQGWTSPSLEELIAPNSRIPITSDQASTLVAALSAGQTLAPLISIVVVDRIGKQKSILAAIVPLIISWVMILLANDVTVLITARLIGGFAMGTVMCITPMYITEILSSNIRGSMTMICVCAFGCGILFVFLVGPKLGVRSTAVFGTAMCALYLIVFWFTPESPYFLMTVGREKEAEAVLGKLRGKMDVSDELELIRSTVNEKGKSLTSPGSGSGESESAVKQLFTIRGNLKALFLGMMLVSLQHFCGYTTLLNYCHIVLEAMGSGLQVYQATVMFALIQVFSVGVIVFIADRAGRRTLIIISGVLTCILLLVIATYFFLIEHTNVEVKQYGIIPLCSTFLFIIALNIGIISVAPIMTAEIFANDVKVLANCIAGIFAALVVTCVTKSYLVVATSWGFGHSIPFFGHAVAAFVCTICVALWLPETRGKTLLEIQRELNA